MLRHPPFLLPLTFFACLLVSFYADAAVNFVPVAKTASPAERAKIIEAGKKVNEVVASQCFADFITKRQMLETNGKTSAQVLEHLRSISGDVPVKMYTRCMKFGFRCPAPTSAVAYRQPPETSINLNRVAFPVKETTCEWAATMAHEGLGHALGNYGHSFEWTKTRDLTVPYSLGGSKQTNGGDAFTNCCK
jgi:hypothetical protein